MGLSSALSKGIERLLHATAARLRRRHLLIPCILVAQTLLLTLIFLNPIAIEAVPAAVAPMSLFDVRAPAEAPAAPAPQTEPVRLEKPAPEIDLKLENLALPAQPVFSPSAAARAGFGTTCDVAETLARAFAENEFIKGELARIGPQSRSVSNAIMFWDSKWVELRGDAPKDAVETLRRAILEGVSAAPAECLTEELAGPRFIFLSDASPTMMLVLGSGTWRWEQLLYEAGDDRDAGPPAQQGRNY